MDNIPQLDATLQHLFGDFADQLARQTKFIKHQAKFSGSSFAKTLVFGWLRNPAASLTALCAEAFSFGTDVHNQTLDHRFSAEAVAFMRQMLEAAVSRLLTEQAASLELLAHFNGVYLLDATTISLPAELVAQWPGAANQHIDLTAGLKLEVLLELRSGELRLRFYPARQHESNTEFNTTDLPPESLRTADLGYYSLKVFGQFNQERRYWLTRWKAGTLMYRASGQRLDLRQLLLNSKAEALDMAVQVGVARVACRLVAIRVPAEVAQQRYEHELAEAKRRSQAPSEERLALAGWDIYLTNVPARLMSIAQARVLYRLRWQIELLFKLWKSGGEIDQSRSQKVQRRLCEVFGKLLAMVVQHWVLLHSGWTHLACSLWQGGQIVRRQIGSFIEHWGHQERALAELLAEVSKYVQRFGKVQRRRGRPSAYQLLNTTADVTLF